MKKKLAGLMLAFALFVPGVFMTACTPAKVVSFEVELANQEYEFVQNQVVVEWGEYVDISPADFVVTATLDNDTTKVLSLKSKLKDGYTFSSNIPDDTITPIGEYKLTFAYGDLDPYEIGLVVEKANVDMSGVTWNYTEPFGYDGTAKTVEVTNLPSGVFVSYQNNSKTEIGDYNAVAMFAVTDTEHYNPIPNMTFAWKIEKGTIDVSGMTWNYTEKFVYDGQPKSVVMSGLPEGCTIDYTGTTSATAVGQYTATAIITPPNADFYNEIEPITLNWEIVKADLAPVTSVNAISKVYEGADITITKDMITGLPANYAVKAITGDVTAKNVGTYNITISFEYTGEGAENYNAIPNLNWTWAITPAPLALTPFAQTTYGQEAGDYGFEGTFLGSDDETILKGEAQYAHNYEVGNNAGDYALTLSGLTADNYEITFEEGTLVVEKAQLTLTPYADPVVYGSRANYSSYDYTIEGLLLNDTKNVIIGNSIQYESYYSQYDAPGEYTFFINPEESNLTAQNYELIFVDGTITCLKRPLTITANDVEVVIGNEAVNAGVNFEGFAGTETESVLSGTLAYDFGGYNPQTAQVGDTFAITPSGLTSDNYEITYTSGTLTVVLPEGLQEDIDGIALLVNEFDYNADTQPPLVVDKTTIPKEVKIGAITIKEGKAILPGTYTAVIELNYTGSETYILQPIERTFTINKVEIDTDDIAGLYSLALTQDTFVYDGTEKTVTLSNLPTWAKVSESTNTSGTVVGSWGATFVIAVSDESFYVAFEPVSITLTWNISPAELTITVNDNTITYGEEPVNAGFTAVGLVGNDTEDVISGISYTYGGYEAGNNVGEYALTIENANAENYTISIVPGKLIVEPAEINLSNATWGTQTEFVFSGEPIMPELKNLPQGVEVNYNYMPANTSSSMGSIGFGLPIDVDVYVAEARFVENPNYTLTNQPSLTFTYNIVPLVIDFTNAEWTIENQSTIDYSGETTLPKLVGFEEFENFIGISYYTIAFGETEQTSAVAPGKYVAYAEVVAIVDEANLSIEGLQSGKTWIEFEIVAQTLSDFAWNVSDELSDEIVSNEGVLDFEISLTTAQISSLDKPYEVWLVGDDIQYVDIEYTYNAEQLADNVTILPGANRQSVQATLTLKEEYQGSNYVLEITEVWLHITVTEQVFASLTLNGEAFAETDLQNGMSFEYGSTLAFTMLEGYFITDKNNTPITSITFTEQDQTYNEETNTFDVIIYADAIGQGFAKAYTFAFPYFLPAFSINGTEYNHDHNEDVTINLELQEDEIIINFDEKYLTKYNFTIEYSTITHTEGELLINKLPYTLQDAHIVDAFAIICEGEHFMRSVVYVNVNQYNPFVLEEFTLAGFTETTTAYFAGTTRINIDNAVIAYVEFTDEQLNSYTRVTAYSDFALTKPVNYLDLASYNYEITYFAVYDDEEQLVAILPKQIIYNYTTKNGFEVGPLFDTQVYNTNGSSVAKVEFEITNSDLQVSATLNGQSEIALNSAQTEDVAFRLELTYSDRTYFFESTWTILKHYDASQRIVATGTVANTASEHKESYQISGNNLNLSYSDYFDAGNIESFAEDLAYLEFEVLSDYSISARNFVKIGNELFIELSFVDAQEADAGKCLIKLYFYGSYDNNTTILAYAMSMLDGSEQEINITNDTITITDLNTQMLAVVTTNQHAYAIVTDSQGNKIADSSAYGYTMAQFKTAGTYSLIIYATDGTTKTYVVVVEGDYIPALSITVGEDSYVLEVSVEDGLSGDYYSDADGNLMAYMGEDKQDLVDSQGYLAITSLKSSMLVNAVVADQDDNVLSASQLANGFNLKVLYTQDENEYPYVQLNVTNTMEGTEVKSLVILYLTEIQDMTILKIVVDSETTLKANVSLQDETISGDFDVQESAMYVTLTAYLGAEAQSMIDEATNTFTISSFEYVYEGFYVDVIGQNEFTSTQNVALMVGEQDGVLYVSFAIIYSMQGNQYVAIIILMLDEPLFQIQYQDKTLVEFMSVGETGPIFTGDFKVSQNQGVTTFVGYLGSYKGEDDLPSTITIDSALCTQGTTFKDGFANPNTVLTAPFKNVALTVGVYQETPAVCILVDENIVIYLLLTDSYPATFTFGAETFNVRADNTNYDFGDIQIGESGPELVIAEEVESFTVTFNETFDDLSYAVITDAEAISALMKGETTLADLGAEGKVYFLAQNVTSYTAPITFVEGVAEILVLAEGCTGQETTDELQNVILPVTIYIQTAE